MDVLAGIISVLHGPGGGFSHFRIQSHRGSARWLGETQFLRARVAERPNAAGENERWLLLETEINVPESATFQHRVKQICSYAGVQNGAQISLDFDPGYESLQLHWIRIWRGTNFLNQLERDKIKVIQQERDLERYALNGEYSAILVLEDVRVGDVIDYAFTFQGVNPVFGGRFARSIQLQSEEPMGRLRTRLLWPAKKRLYAKYHGTSAQPVVIPGKEVTEYLLGCETGSGAGFGRFPAGLV